MAEPSDAVFNISEIFANNGSRADLWGNSSIQSHALTTPVATQRVDGYPYSSMESGDNSHFDATTSDWPATENSGPISTPAAVVVEPPPPNVVAPFYNAGQNRWYTRIDGANAVATPYHQYAANTYENFDRRHPMLLNVIRGAGGIDFHRYSITTPAPLDLSSAPYQYQHQHHQIPAPYYHQQPLAAAATYSVGLPLVHGNPLHNYSMAPGRMYPYRSANDVMAMGEHLAPLRPPILETQPAPAPASDGQPTPPICNHGAPLTFAPKPPPVATCYLCSRHYINERSYHDHWLRVHVLHTAETIEKRSKIASANASSKPKKRSLPFAADAAPGTTFGENRESMDDQYTNPENRDFVPALNDEIVETTAEYGNDAQEVTTTMANIGNQSRATAAAQQPVGIAMESSSVLDLSVKPAMPHLLMLLNSNSSHVQHVHVPLGQGGFTLDGRPVDPRAKRIALIVPPSAMTMVQRGGGTTNATAGQVGDDGSKTTNSPEKKFACSNCDKAYRSRRSLQKHMHIHHDPVGPPKKPQSVFENIEEMEKKPFPCGFGFCTKRFETERSRNSHVTRFHKELIR